MFDAVVTPTITCGAGSCTTAKGLERVLRTTQRRMLRLITQRKSRCKNWKETGGRDTRDDEISEETREETSANDDCNQDSSISFDDDEESTTRHEDNLEDWIEHVKRSTREADEKMQTWLITS